MGAAMYYYPIVELLVTAVDPAERSCANQKAEPCPCKKSHGAIAGFISPQCKVSRRVVVSRIVLNAQTSKTYNSSILNGLYPNEPHDEPLAHDSNYAAQ